MGAAVLVAGAVAVGASPAAASPSGGAIPPPITLIVPIAGAWNVPETAVGVALNLTVTSPVASGYAVAYPCGGVRPMTSNVNFTAGQTVPNFVIAGLGADGSVCIETSATTDVIVDLAGYVPAGSPLQFLPRPDRIVDTRIGVGVPRALRAGEPVGFSLPAAAAGVMNVTVTATAREGYLTVYPCGAAVPATSTSNFSKAGTVPNLVVAAAGTGGNVCVVSSADTELVVDLAATLPAGYSGMSMLASPQRIVDTRVGLGGPVAPVTGADRVVQVVGAGVGVPPGSTAAIVNVTGTRAAANGFVSAYPCGGTPPTVSNLNVAPARDVANAAIVKLAADGTMCLRSNTTTDVIVDVAGYVQGSAAFVPVTPDRIFDSREGVDPTCNLGVGSGYDGLSILDLTTWTRGATLGPSAADVRQIRISSDCSVISVVSSQPPSSMNSRSLRVHDRTGVVLASVEAADDLLVADPGIVGYARGTGRVYDAETGETLFEVPAPWRGEALWDVSQDGSTFLVGSPGGRWAAFDADGFDLGLVLPAGLQTFARPLLSPSGVYVAYETLQTCADPGPAACRPGRGIPGTWVVATIDGNVVDRFPVSTDTALLGRPTWVSDGLLMLSRWQTYNVGPPSRVEAVRWELFNAPKVVWSGISLNQTYTMWAGR